MPGFVINGQGGPAQVTPGNRDWLRSNRFELINFFGQITSSSPEFIALKDVTLPDKKLKSIDVKTPGTTYKFASQADFNELKMVFYGSRALLTKCLQISDKPHNVRDGIRDYQEYKGEVVFQIRDQGGFDGSFSGVEYNYKGAWVSQVMHGQVSYSSSEIMAITAIIEFDFFEVTEFGDIGQSIVSNDNVTPILGIYNGENSR